VGIVASEGFESIDPCILHRLNVRMGRYRERLVCGGVLGVKRTYSFIVGITVRQIGHSNAFCVCESVQFVPVSECTHRHGVKKNVVSVGTLLQSLDTFLGLCHILISGGYKKTTRLLTALMRA